MARLIIIRLSGPLWLQKETSYNLNNETVLTFKYAEICHFLQMQGEKGKNYINSSVSVSFTITFLGADTKLSLHEMPEKRDFGHSLQKDQDKVAQCELCCLQLLHFQGSCFNTGTGLSVLICFCRNLYPEERPNPAAAELVMPTFAMPATRKPFFPQKNEGIRAILLGRF